VGFKKKELLTQTNKRKLLIRQDNRKLSEKTESTSRSGEKDMRDTSPISLASVEQRCRSGVYLSFERSLVVKKLHSLITQKYKSMCFSFTKKHNNIWRRHFLPRHCPNKVWIN